MGWTVKREIDVIPKHSGIVELPKANIISTWEEPAGVFIYKACCADDTISINVYAAAAIAARNKWQLENATDAGIGIAVMSRINLTDPQIEAVE